LNVTAFPGEKDPPHVIEAVAAAKNAEREGRWTDACDAYEQLIRSPAASVETRLSALRWLGRAYVQKGEWRTGLDVLEAALAAADQAGSRTAVAQARNVMAIAWQSTGELDLATRQYEMAREIADSVGDKALVAMLDQNLGTVASIRGDMFAALSAFESSLVGYRSLGMLGYQGQVLNNIGLVHMDLSEFGSADAAYASASRAFKESGDRQNEMVVELNQIQLWIATGRLDDAGKQADRLLLIAREECPPWSGELHRHLGVIARERADHQTAAKHFERAAAAAAEVSDLMLSADVAEQMAELYWSEHRHREMLSSLNDAFSIYSRLRAQRRVADVERRNTALEARFLKIARRWGDSIEGKDQYTHGHCERVANLATSLAQRAGLDPRSIFWFRLGAVLHDIGKIIVPTEVLNKAGPLTGKEWELMKKHTEVGFEMVSGIDFPGNVPAMIRSHHERWDGGGYPDGLAGEDIPFAARVLCIADVYDALTTTRPYRVALSHATGLEIMCSSTTQFDPTLLSLFVELLGQ
jgi:putative nucleotidyltransferase with HDIG domain